MRNNETISSPVLHRNILSLVVLFITVSFSAIQTGVAQTSSNVTVFEGARLIVGDGSATIEDSAFIVVDDRLTHIGRRGVVVVPSGATLVNLRGKTVMPTIIDTHKHLSGDREKLIEQLRKLAYFGIGAVLSLGQDVSDQPFKVRDEIIPGAARFYTAGRGITTPEPGRSEVAYWIKSAEEGREAIQEQAARKVDFIKIWVDDRNGQYKKTSQAQYSAIIDEAHKHGIRVAAHIYSMSDAKGLLRAGLDAFAHGIRDRDIDDETVALFKERPHVVLIPNLPNRGVATDMSWLRGSIPDEELNKLQAGATDKPKVQEFFGIQARNMVRLHKAGVKVTQGTDGSVLWEPHVQMEDMVAAGLTPSEVIVAATHNSAELLRLNDAGTMEAGKSADFIVLDANPLEDITNTRRINSVYLRGKIIDRD
ncbi:MAG: imidazolonepropionase-like amidohydrolase [Gammaproteobacteria bacterium]|jgi:imidazolonepropionase-like amidohydrolase